MRPDMFPGPVLRSPVLEADRDKALLRTADTMQKLAEICRKLEVVPDAAALRIALEIHQSAERDVVAEREREELAARMQRLPMDIISMNETTREPLRLARGQICQLTARPQWAAYRVEEIEIHGDASRWKVHEITVGNRKQSLNSHGPWPGELFRKGGLMSEVRLETLQTAMDFVMVVEYVGPESDGEVFRATMVGTAV